MVAGCHRFNVDHFSLFTVCSAPFHSAVVVHATRVDIGVEKKITISLYKFQHTRSDLCNIQKFLNFVVPPLVIVLFDFNSLKAATQNTQTRTREPQ